MNELPVVESSRSKSSCCAALWLLLAGIFGATGVGMGAYEAHGLEKMLIKSGVSAEEIAKRTDDCQTAVRYQLVHAVALLGLASAAQTFGCRCFQITGGAWLVGTLLFSGILYTRVFMGDLGIGILVMFGGISLIIGWVSLAVGAVYAMGCCKK